MYIRITHVHALSININPYICTYVSTQKYANTYVRTYAYVNIVKRDLPNISNLQDSMNHNFRRVYTMDL